MVTVPWWHLHAAHGLLHTGSICLLLAIALDSWIWVNVLVADGYNQLCVSSLFF